MVAGSDVADLVRQHSGQLGLIFQIGQQAAIDVDVATGQGKGVDVGAVDHGKGKCRIGFIAVGDQSLADTIDIGLQFRVIVGSTLRNHLLVHPLACRRTTGTAVQ